MEPRPPEAWEQGCREDAIRNGFVIPFLEQFVHKAGPEVIGDIGCGTGYMSRELARLLVPKQVRWHLIDYDPGMLAYAQQRCADIKSAEFHNYNLCAVAHDATPPEVDLGFVAYTYLDIEVTRQVAINTAKLIRTGGHLVIFTPDVLEDVEQAMVVQSHLLTDYRRGLSSILSKRDKFTGLEVTFRANRTENMLEFLLADGLQLIHIQPYRSASDKLHYCFVFGKSGKPLAFP